MSDEIRYVDADSEDFEDAPKALRDAYKKLVTAHKQVTQNLADTRGQVAARAVADVLADKKFKNPERVKKDLLDDKVDPSDTDAINAWLEQNSGDYAMAEAAPAAEENPPSSSVSAEVQQAYGNLAVAGSPATSDQQAVFSKITPEMDGKAVIALFKQHGL